MSKRTFPINLNRYLIALLAGTGGGGGYTPPAGAEGDLLVFHAGVWGSVIAPGLLGTILTSVGPGVVPVYQGPQKIAIGPIAFIDPANSTGFASDSNTGANATNTPPGTGPILTTAHASSLLFNRFLTGDRTITYMSDDTSEVGLDFSSLSIGSFQLTIQGTPQVLHTGGTINAGTTAINPGGNQRQLVHTSDLATFNPYVFTSFGGAAANFVYILDETPF